MSQTLGANGNELTLVIPSALERDWATSIRDNCFQKISDHNHTGSGNGKKLIAADSIDSASAWVANNVFIKSKNAAGNSTVDLIKANASDLVEIGTLIASMSVKSGGLSIKDSTDITKILQLDVSAISTATTRTLTLPNSNVDLGALVNANISASASIALSKLAALTANKLLVSDASGVISASSVTDTEAGYLSGVTSAIQTQINAKQASDATLTALAAYNTNGLIAQTAADTFAGRTITGTASEIDVSNGDGVSGNPTIGISDNPVLPGTGSVTLPSGTTAQRSGSPVAGMVRYNSDLTRFEGYKGGAWGEIGGGSAGINYIEDKDAEAGIGSWATYADAAGSNAVDGTGGSPNITFTQNSSSPLRGTNDFKLAKDAANRQGEGASYDFTIEKADLSKKLYISFDYDASSANYADNDIRVQVYDVTNGVLIRCNGEDLKAGKNSHLAWFQTDATSTSYRLILHVSSTNASAYDVYLDNISVGPREVSYGGAMTDWQDYTLTIGATSVAPTQGAGATKTARWRRLGDSMEINFLYYQTAAGSSGTGIYLFPLPSGYTIDTNKVSISTGAIGATGNILGIANLSTTANATTTNATLAHVIAYNTTNLSISNLTAASNQRNLVSSTEYSLSSNPLYYSFSVKVPIAGWSSNALQSQDIGNREIRVEAAGNSGASITANTVPIDFTLVSDTTASWTQVGANGRDTFTAPESGMYTVTANVRWTTAVGANIFDYIDPATGVFASNKLRTENAATNNNNIVSFEIYLLKGYRLQLRTNTTATLSNSTSLHWITISKKAQPQTVLETEVVAATYSSNAGITATNGSNYIYEDKELDTHGAYNTSTGVYTIPVTGVYSLKASVTPNSSINTSVTITVNSVSKAMGYNVANDNSSVYTSINLPLNKGDTVNFVNTTGATRTLTTNSKDNFFSIARIK